jgi:hypothetical protein
MTTAISPYYHHTTMGGYIGLNPQIVHWKPKNTPQGVMSGSIRPFTNKDYTNTTLYKQGATRPNKRIYRTGYNIANQSFVNSSVISNGLLQTMDAPGLSTTIGGDYITSLEYKKGIPLCVSDMIPNYNLTDNPRPVSCSQSFCCNPEIKARRSSYAANTVKRPNYYTNTNQYLYNRNKTYNQNSFHYFKSSKNINVESSATTSQERVGSKPGGPISTWDNYKYHTNGHCAVSDNGKICQKEIMYNPSNYTFAKQGPVTDRTRMLSLMVNTLSNASKQRLSRTM